MATLQDIQRYVAPSLLRKETVKTSLKATAYLNQLYKTKKAKGGDEFYVPIRRSDQYTA